MHASPRYRPSAAILELGEGSYDPVAPARFPAAILRFRNDLAAARIGLDDLDDAAWIDHFARFAPLPGGLARPLALRYHGHQFGTYNPALGDGRGFLFGQVIDPDDGRLLDLGTKGSGTTPYSRGGDGRLTLKGGVRELLASEMLAAQGVPTCATFSLVETGERLHRGDEPSPTRSSVLVRLSHSHVRFGTFQRLAYHRDREGLARLVDYCARHLLPECARPEIGASAAALVEAATARTAALCGRWMVAGFVHGVLNSDNLSVTGESFDYGPYRWTPRHDLGFVAAYFDHTGLYAYGRQPQACLQNLVRLATALAGLAAPAELERALSGFAAAHDEAIRRAFCRRLGVASRGAAADDGLVDAAYAFLGQQRVGLDRFFFDWYGGATRRMQALAGPAAAAYDGALFDEFADALADAAPIDGARLDHAYFQGEGPCSLLIDEIEAIWAAIDERDEWSPVQAKVAAIRAAGEAWRTDGA
ncbi:MAG: YdiU family protein [Nannocystaceae bacterium]